MSEPEPTIHGRQQGANLHQQRLHLDNQEGAPHRVPGEEVDDTALAVDRERRFRDDLPAEPLKHLDNRPLQDRMDSVEQPDRVVAWRPQTNVEPRSTRLRDGSGSPDRHTGQPTGLDVDDGRSWDAGAVGDVDLPKAAPTTEEPHDRADLSIVHGDRVVRADQRALTGGSTRGCTIERDACKSE